MGVIFNPNCIWYGKKFGRCYHPKRKGWFGRKLCILPNKKCDLQEEYLELTKPSPMPPRKINA